MTIELEADGNFVDAYEGSKKIDTVAVYFENEKVWVFNNDAINKNDLQYTKDLFIKLFNPEKVIYLSLEQYSLTKPCLGSNPTLRQIFYKYESLFIEENAEGLNEIAPLIGEDFDKEAFIREARRREIEDLFESIAYLDVPLPEKLKKTDPFNYAKLRLLRLQKIQDALEQLNVQPKEVNSVEG